MANLPQNEFFKVLAHNLIELAVGIPPDGRGLGQSPLQGTPSEQPWGLDFPLYHGTVHVPSIIKTGAILRQPEGRFQGLGGRTNAVSATPSWPLAVNLVNYIDRYIRQVNETDPARAIWSYFSEDIQNPAARASIIRDRAALKAWLEKIEEGRKTSHRTNLEYLAQRYHTNDRQGETGRRSPFRLEAVLAEAKADPEKFAQSEAGRSLLDFMFGISMGRRADRGANVKAYTRDRQTALFQSPLHPPAGMVDPNLLTHSADFQGVTPVPGVFILSPQQVPPGTHVARRGDIQNQEYQILSDVSTKGAKLKLLRHTPRQLYEILKRGGPAAIAAIAFGLLSGLLADRKGDTDVG